MSNLTYKDTNSSDITRETLRVSSISVDDRRRTGRNRVSDIAKATQLASLIREEREREREREREKIDDLDGRFFDVDE